MAPQAKFLLPCALRFLLWADPTLAINLRLSTVFSIEKLAKFSQMPGKRSYDYFFTTEKIDFVDLPGYGYAKVAKSEKARWDEMINGYFDQYRYYALVVSLYPNRHPGHQA